MANLIARTLEPELIDALKQPAACHGSSADLLLLLAS